MWGAVQEVTLKRLVLSLPHGLRAFVTPEEASDVLHSLATATPSTEDKRLRHVLKGAAPTLPDLFYPGQFVRAVIVRLEDSNDGVEPPKPAVRCVSGAVALLLIISLPWEEVLRSGCCLFTMRCVSRL